MNRLPEKTEAYTWIIRNIRAGNSARHPGLIGLEIIFDTDETATQQEVRTFGLLPEHAAAFIQDLQRAYEQSRTPSGS